MKTRAMLYGIVLMASNSDGTIHIDTPHSRFLGKPPIILFAQSLLNSVPNPGWRWHHSQFAIYQSTSVHVPVALVARDEKGRVADRRFLCRHVAAGIPSTENYCFYH